MGRIPKLVKEKALAEHQLSSSSTENDDPSRSNDSSPTSCIQSINSNIFPSGDFSLELIDEQLFLNDIDSISFDDFPEKLSSCASSIVPDNYPIDDIKHDYDEDIFKLNRSDLINSEEQYFDNIIERIKKLAPKISQTIINTELDCDDLSFINYLRWKIINLSNIYNEHTRQLIERMKTMINLDVNKNL